jgi:serine/threonine protein kinase
MTSSSEFGSLNYEILGIIGKGGTSTVYKIRKCDDDSVYAMKEIEVDQLSSSQVVSIQAEIRTLENLSHPNIVSFHGMKTDATKFLLFMEYADYGSLRIFYKNYGYLSITESLYCVQQIVKGLEYLHEKGVAHRDIKCANCLIFHQNYLIKLADFGASKRIEHESIISGLKGTPQWMAPEVSVYKIFLIINCLYKILFLISLLGY